MGKIRKRFEDYMSAASFAEAGEFETAKEMLQGRKTVLLVLTGKERDDKSFSYALNTAKRTDSSLEVLVVSQDKRIPELLRGYSDEARKEGVGFEVSRKSGCIKEAIVSLTKRRGDIRFVVVESTNALDIDCAHEDRRLDSIWRKLECPLVLVSELEAT